MSEIKEDLYEEKLKEKTSVMHNCQAEKELQSCLTCKEILECDTRDAYVEAVYASMAKGAEGGFEF